MADEGIGKIMATGFASTLTEGQPAQLDLGDEAFPAWSSASPAPKSCSPPTAELPEDALESDGESYLLIDAGGSCRRSRPASARLQRRRARRDAARPVPPRSAPDLQPRAARPARAPAPAGRRGAPATTFTRDVSAGGLRVKRQSTYRPADVHSIVIALVQAEREIRATAATVRETSEDVSLSFVEIGAEDRLILAQLTFAYHRRSARQ